MTHPDEPAAKPDGEALQMMRYEANKKSMFVAYFLWFFLGYFAAHRFYLGRRGTALVILGLWVIGFILAFVVVGFFILVIPLIWVLVDAFLIHNWVRDHNNRLIEDLQR